AIPRSPSRTIMEGTCLRTIGNTMQSKHAPRTTVATLFGLAAVLLLSFTILAGPASAQVGTYGSVVKAGDADWFPSAKKTSTAASVLYYDPTGTGMSANLCVVLRSGGAPAGGIGFT